MHPLQRTHTSTLLSMIGGGANGGSAKPKEEREQMDRENAQRQEDKGNPVGSDDDKANVGGTSNDNRSDEDRAGGSFEVRGN